MIEQREGARSLDDPSILELLHSRDPKGADALLERYGGLIHYVARGILNDPREIEECVSDVCLKLWQVPERFDPEKSSLATWLTAVTRNAALNRLKALRRQEERQTDLEESAVSEEESPEEAVLRQERAEQLRRALERLNGKERTLFYRKYYYLQSTAQIAAELGMSERAAEGRLYRLRQKLRRWLGGEDDA